MNYKYYAKSNPIETIKEHTNKLLENLRILKRTYGSKIVKVIDMPEDRFWQLMEIICKYHDVGKVYSGFQNAIRKNIGKPLLQPQFNNEEMKHEQISPMFVPYKEYELTKIEKKLVYQAIYYHHERNNTMHIDRELLKIEPTILDKITLDSPIMQEEIFGLILPIITFDNIEEVKHIILQGEKPLALYLFTKNKKVRKKWHLSFPHCGS